MIQKLILFICFQRRNDREEIRRRLAMGADEETAQPTDQRRLSLQTRLQTGESWLLSD